MSSFADDGFSVVMPTHGRPRSLLRVLDAVAAQDYEPDLLEVVVVVDGPDETPVRLLGERTYPFRLEVHQQPRRGPAAARNAGLRLASGPFVLFLDDDVIPEPRLVSEHRLGHGSEPDLAVIGPLLAPPTGGAAPWTEWEWATLEEQYRAMTAGEWQPTARQFYTGNASVRREHLLAVGGFDEEFRRGEDVELAWRLHARGVRFHFRPEAAGTHLARRTFRSWLAAAYEYGRTDVMLGRIRTGDVVPAWVLREFGWRHRRTRQLARAGLRHRWLVPAVRGAGEPVLRSVALVGGATRAQQACSAAFTMTYWTGVADQVGDRRRVLELLAGAGAP